MGLELDSKENFRYVHVYNYYKDLIMQEKIQPGTRLPSIRSGAVQFQISRTTMENAYLLLAAEGYILSRPQSGYYVTDIAKKQKQAEKQRKVREKKQEILYDFFTVGVDKDSFHFDLWRRYMKSALRENERLLSYGEPQGELEFREVLCEYLREHRSVICTPEQIVIGAGVQSLFHILCPLIQENQKIAFYNSGFRQGITVFEDHGFEIVEKDEASVYYITPSQMQGAEEIMSTQERLELIKKMSDQKILLIEDDYNHEFHYFQKQVPSIQGLAGGNGVIYLGSFSKMLLPSIRMSFMILPPDLLELYEKRRDFYNQTASKAEQIALTQFIRDGHLERQIRKSRKIHMTRTRELANAALEIWGQEAKLQIHESGFGIRIWFASDYSEDEVKKRWEQEGIAAGFHGKKHGMLEVSLISTHVETEKYKEILKKMKALC